MANELSRSDGIDLTLHYAAANPGANGTAAYVLAQGGAGLVVPTGYAFHPLLLHAEANAAISVGSASVIIRADTTQVPNAPTVTLDTTHQKGLGVGRVGAGPIAAGKIISVALTTSADYSATTVDHDVILIGKLLPV